MNSKTLPLFTDIIYLTDLSKHSSTNEYFYNKVKKIEEKNRDKKSQTWRCDTFSTQNFYNLGEDENFKIILTDIKESIVKFAREFGVNDCEPITLASWINLAPPGEYQEYHIHNASHFSIVYYVKTPKNSGNLVFKSHRADKNMYPLPVESYTMASSLTYTLEPVENRLIIFRSDLLHMVEKNKSDEDRVSISCNFHLQPKS